KVNSVVILLSLLTVKIPTSLQLQCDKRDIRAHIGEEFIIVCTYESKFLFSKKYWCRGPSRHNCDILRDTDGVAKPKNKNRLRISDMKRRIFVMVTNLQIEDSDVYWIGIEKMNADIMTSIKVTVTLGKSQPCVSGLVKMCACCLASSLVAYTLWSPTYANKLS
uniref:Immunoglobulin V-set domain-containing protein n=1 Tax=Poecilia reticulata TaxID=8081 RepID=A0A3P9QFX6_POERE